MRVKVDYGDGSEPEELDVQDGSMHFHPFPEGDTEKHTVTVEVLEEDPVEEEPPSATPSPEAAPVEEYDPGAHTVGEVQAYVTDHPDQLEAVYEAEVAGRNRTTLVAWLENLFPYDPGAWTVTEVLDYAADNPSELEAIITAEQAGKNRSTLISQLEAMRA